MAVLALTTSLQDMKDRLGNMVSRLVSKSIVVFIRPLFVEERKSNASFTDMSFSDLLSGATQLGYTI
jgi:hypothetical protein